MAEANDLPPWPDDEWGQWLSPRGLVNGDVWVRSSSAAERHPRIEILSGSRALRFLEELSTMELSGYIGWINIHRAAPRTPVKDLEAIVRKSSDLRHQWAVASGDVLTRILERWS